MEARGYSKKSYETLLVLSATGLSIPKYVSDNTLRLERTGLKGSNGDVTTNGSESRFMGTLPVGKYFQ